MSLVPPENPFISRGIDQYVWETHMESTSFSRDLLKVRGSSVIRRSRRLPKHFAFGFVTLALSHSLSIRTFDSFSQELNCQTKIGVRQNLSQTCMK